MHRHRAGARRSRCCPFDVVGEADPSTLSLRDGLAVDLGSRLSRLTDLWVAPRTSMRALGGLSVREIGKRLGVDTGARRARCSGPPTAFGSRASLVDAAHERPVLPAIVIDRTWRRSADDPG